MTQFFNWVSANSTVIGGDFNITPVEQIKGDIRYWVSEGPNTDRKYWYADSYVNSSSNNLSGLSWTWLRDRRFTIYVLFPLLLRRGLSIITDIMSYHSYEPSSSMFMNINYDPTNPNEPLVKPPTKEELLYVFMSAGISNPEMLENFYSSFHVSSQFDVQQTSGLTTSTRKQTDDPEIIKIQLQLCLQQASTKEAAANAEADAEYSRDLVKAHNRLVNCLGGFITTTPTRCNLYPSCCGPGTRYIPEDDKCYLYTDAQQLSCLTTYESDIAAAKLKRDTQKTANKLQRVLDEKLCKNTYVVPIKPAPVTNPVAPIRVEE
jgi:hypothetical protein